MEQGWRIATEVAERLSDGKAFFVVPTGVMRELDGLKKAEGEKGKKAFEATRRIHELVSMGRARIVRGNGSVKGVLASPVDEEVLSVAREWKEKGKTYLLTTDRAQMAVANQQNIFVKTIAYKNPQLSQITLLLWCLSILFWPLIPINIYLYKRLRRKYQDEKRIVLEDLAVTQFRHQKELIDNQEHEIINPGCPCPICQIGLED